LLIILGQKWTKHTKAEFMITLATNIASHASTLYETSSASLLEWRKDSIYTARQAFEQDLSGTLQDCFQA